MQTTLTCIALGTALGAQGATIGTSPTARFNDGYYFFVNDTSARSLTIGKDVSVLATADEERENSTQMAETYPTSSSKHVKIAELGAWITSALVRLNVLKSSLEHEVEEKHLENAGRAIRDAETVLLKLAAAGLQKRPAIGWDSAGSVSFNVSFADFSADFTAHGDGKFSFSAKKGSEPPVLDELQVGDPLPKALSRLLA